MEDPFAHYLELADVLALATVFRVLAASLRQTYSCMVWPHIFGNVFRGRVCRGQIGTKTAVRRPGHPGPHNRVTTSRAVKRPSNYARVQ